MGHRGSHGVVSSDLVEEMYINALGDARVAMTHDAA
jgi:hypothetical protein